MLGLTMYSIVEQPITRKNNSINFELVYQENRFVYVGVCNREIFKSLNYNGPLYAKGNMMYSIRQCEVPDSNAISLHNSNNMYSN